MCVIVWDLNKAIDIERWWVCGGGRLERIYCIYIYIDIETSINRETMGPTLNGAFREVVSLGS